MATPVELLEILEALTDNELKKFKWLLSSDVLEGFPAIPKSLLENADRLDTVDQLADKYNHKVVEVTIKVLKMISKHELVQRLLGFSSTSKETISHCQSKLKLSLRKRLQSLLNSTSSSVKPVFLKGLYTELDTLILNDGNVDTCRLIYSPICGKTFLKRQNCEEPEKSVKRTLIKGVSGTGKTIFTQKVVLDWTEDKFNNKVQFVLPISFKELNSLNNKTYNIVDLLHYFFPDLKDAGINSFDGLEIQLIFDGLSDCQLPLDFDNNELLNDITESATVDVLLTNLFIGRLLPSANVWITTTPEVEKKIPPQYVHSVTQVKGFTDQKRDEYLRRRFRNKEVACKIISHIETSERLKTWCRLPLCCHVCAAVLEDELKTSDQLNTPKTLTELYIRFFGIQSKRATAESSHSVILCLAKLAFEQLLKNNQLFSEEDLMECGTDARAVSSYSEVFTAVGEENKLFCFVHSSFHFFLAAVHVAASFISSGINLLSKEALTSVQNLHQTIIHQVSQNIKNIQVYLRFLLGLSLQTNESLLKNWLKLSGRSLENRDATVLHIQNQLRENLPPDKFLRLLHCLNELSVSAVEDEVQKYLTSSTYEVSPDQLSALFFILLTSESFSEEFDQNKYCRESSDLFSFMPLMQASKRCVLKMTPTYRPDQILPVFGSSKLKELVFYGTALIYTLAENIKNNLCYIEIFRDYYFNCGFTLSSVFTHESNCIKELDIYSNIANDASGLLAVLDKPHCKLEKLRMADCNLKWKDCDPVAYYLCSPWSTLTELDLSLNLIQDEGVMVLSTALKSPRCKLQILRLSICGLTDRSCDILASVLSESCSLSRLDLSRNNLCDSGVRLLSGAMKHPRCRLISLSLRECQLSAESCAELAVALSSQTCHLKELDLSSNDLRDSGVQLLCVGLQSPQCALETLRLSGCAVTEEGCASLASALRSSPSHLTELDLSYNYPGETGEKLLSAASGKPLWRLRTLRFDHGGAHRIRSGLRKYGCELTLDPNTAHRNIVLSENNKRLEYARTPEPYPFHPDRFDSCKQVMCREGLTSRCYWEVQYKDEVEIAASYRGISRRGSEESSFGCNHKSWRFTLSSHCLFVQHNGQAIDRRVENMTGTDRLAVLLDWEAGFLSLYSVCSDSLTHLHTLYSSFTEPLFPGFTVEKDVLFCQIAEHVNE